MRAGAKTGAGAKRTGPFLAGSVADRMQKVAEHVGGASRLAELSAVPLRTLNEYLAGRKVPTERMVAIADAADVSVEWLAAGRGAMARARDSVTGDLTTPEGFVLVPRYEVRAAAGAGAMVQSEQIVGYLAFKSDWLRIIGRSARNLVVIEATGDSMEGTIGHGDVMLVDRNDTQLKHGRIYALVYGGALVVKRIERRRDGSMVIKSDNPTYAPETVTPEEVNDLHIVGEVVWAGGPV